MAMVYHQQKPLTPNQIINLSQIWPRRYNAQMAKNELKKILRERGSCTTTCTNVYASIRAHLLRKTRTVFAQDLK